jgi:hypothetical protein
MKKSIITSAMATVLAFGITTAFADDHGQSNNNPGALKAPNKTPEFPSCWLQSATFYSAEEVLSFHVAKTEDTAAGILRVRTQDCCIAGDEWQAEIVADQPRFNTDAAVGDGSTATFTGDAYVAPFIAGNVNISYDSGVDIFPAGMTIEFCYSREREDGLDELSITPN